MTLERTLIRRVVMFGASTVITTLAAAQTHSSVLLVVTKEENSLKIIDPASGNILGAVPVGQHPHNVAASTDGKLAFVVNQVSGSISVIDIAARKELRRVEIGPGSRPHGIYYAAGKVYFTADGYREIGCYDPASNQIEWRVGTGQDGETGMIVVTKDARKIFATNNRTDTVTALQQADVPAGEAPARGMGGIGWSITQIQVGKEPMGIDISPDEKDVWVASQTDGGISIIDVPTLKVRRNLASETKMSNRLKFTPDGKLVLVASSYSHEVLVYDALIRNPQVIKRVTFELITSAIQVAPDSLHAYVSLEPPNGIYTPHDKVAIIDLKTMEVTGYISPGQHPEGMAWAETQ
jgi:YVTN family beta-propeller protein